MNLDDFKEPWQQRQRELDGRVDHVIKKVRSRMSGFDRTIWFRDMREGIAAVTLFVWYSFDLLRPQNGLAKFGTVLGMLACIIIVAVLHWARVKAKTARHDLPVENYCKAELVRVDRQIWLLRNVHWWYLGPLLIAISIQIVANQPDPGGLITMLIFVVPFFGFIYWLNQVAVRNQLMPLRKELTQAIAGNSDDDLAADNETITPLQPLRLKRRQVIFAVMGLFAALTIGACLMEFVEVNDSAPKVSPFTEIRFEQQQIIVTYQGQTYEWLELDEIKVEDIVATAKWRFWGRWQKRLSEDLVDVLWKMDHQPGDTVSLLLRDLETDERRFVEKAPMTEENRSAVDQNQKNDELKAKARQDSDHLSEKELKELPIDQTLRDRLVGRYELKRNFIIDVQDHDQHLSVTATDQPTNEFFPDSANRWSSRTVEAILEFELGPEGPAKRLILHQNGYHQSAKRIND